MKCHKCRSLEDKFIRTRERGTKTMLIRGVPVSLWSEIRDYCERHDLKLRDFLEISINLVEIHEP